MPGIPCCDICDLSVFNRCRPGVRTRPSKKSKLPDRGQQDFAATVKLEDWRNSIFARNHAGSQLDPTSILDDSTIKSLTTVGSLTRSQLTNVLSDTWIWWPQYGEELISHLASLQIKYVALPKKVLPLRQAVKRSAELDAEASSTSGKRARTDHIVSGSNGTASEVSIYRLWITVAQLLTQNYASGNRFLDSRCTPPTIPILARALGSASIHP